MLGIKEMGKHQDFPSKNFFSDRAEEIRRATLLCSVSEMSR